MTAVEVVAALFGILSVYLSTREHIWAWPTAIVNVGLYALVFFQARLYADAGLQVIYLLLSFYGWWAWLYGGTGRSTLTVSRAPLSLYFILVAVDLVAWLVLAGALHRHTDAAIPYLDSALTTTSLVAQWMMTRKLLENWTLWIALDIVYVPTFIWRGLYPTAALYAVFLALAIKGHRDWRRSWLATHSRQ